MAPTGPAARALLVLLSVVLSLGIVQGKPKECTKRSTPQPIAGEYDFIIVGSGAGSVVAARLSEKYNVLLLESGKRVFDQTETSNKLIDSILVGNGLPFLVGDLEVDGTVVGKVDRQGQIVDASGKAIGTFTRPIPQHSAGGVFLHGEDVSARARVINGEPNPYALPDGSAFGLHIQETPFMVPYLSMSNASYFFNLVPQIFSQKREISYPRGNLLGGSSATNWMVFFKGTRHDFDQLWRDEHGLEGWGYDDLAPYFVKLENSTSPSIRGSAKHGTEGPIKTSVSAEFIDFPPAASWFEAARKLGWAELEDANDPENQYGCSNRWQQLVSDTGRRSDATEYLQLADKAGRVCWDKEPHESGAHQTLHVWTEQFVTKVLVDEGSLRATGVEFVSSAQFPFGARTPHPDFAEAADEGLKHQSPFSKYDTAQARKTTLGAPVSRERVLDYKNLGEQYIPGAQPKLEPHVRRVTARREVILAAGTVGTAQLLLLSGIGPKDDLRARDIKVLVDLPVGQRVQDHQEVEAHFKFPATYEPHFDFAKEAPTFPSVAAWREGKKNFLGTNHVLGGLEGSSRGPTSEDKTPTYHMHHLAYGPIENVDFHMVFEDESLRPPYRLPRSVAEFFGFQGTMVHSHICELSGNHAHGRIELRSADPLTQPFIDLRWGSSQEDNRELSACIREVRRIMEVANPEHVGTEFGPCADAHSDEELDLCVRNTVWGHHICGSAPMGTCGDKFAVTDSRGRVFGVEGLRIVDASIFPEVPHGNPMGVVYAVAEKLSDLIKEDHGATATATKDEL